MPTYKAFILNKELNINYETDQKEKLIKSIEEINSKLKNFNNPNGKISDTKLLSFLAIKLQAELSDFHESKKLKTILEKKIDNLNSENINLKEKLFQIREENKFINEENELVNKELIKMQKQIDMIKILIKKHYE